MTTTTKQALNLPDSELWGHFLLIKVAPKILLECRGDVLLEFAADRQACPTERLRRFTVCGVLRCFHIIQTGNSSLDGREEAGKFMRWGNVAATQPNRPQNVSFHETMKSFSFCRIFMNSFIQRISIGTLLAMGLSCATAAELDWSQYRGPNGSGVSETGKPPIEFGPGKNVEWKIKIPSGVSSPTIADNKILITALEEGRLMTLCLDRNSGKKLWRKLAPDVPLENFHQYANQASSTPATDGKNVYVYFGSYGVIAYSLDGEELWKRPFKTPPTMFGTGTSPIIYNDMVILQRDGDFTESNVIAMDAKTGATIWEAKRPAPGGGYSTPMIWNHDGESELIAIGKGLVTSYGPSNGNEKWFARGMTFSAIAVAVAGNGMLYASSTGTGDPADPLILPTWNELMKHDANEDGLITSSEVPQDMTLKVRQELSLDVEGNALSIAWLVGAPMVDTDQSKSLTEDEWIGAVEFFDSNRDHLIAIKPGGRSDATDSHVVWDGARGLSEMPSPLFYQNRLYYIRNGGLFTSYDPQSGKRIIDRERIGIVAQFVQSPVAADGRIYVGDESGRIAVIKAGDELNILAKTDLEERLWATPAIVGDTIYYRTENHLWAFAE